MIAYPVPLGAVLAVIAPQRQHPANGLRSHNTLTPPGSLRGQPGGCGRALYQEAGAAGRPLLQGGRTILAAEV